MEFILPKTVFLIDMIHRMALKSGKVYLQYARESMSLCVFEM
jgi:hypothetical protein